MAEIKAFCKRYSIPHAIWIETKDGKRSRTPENDRKGVILDRIRSFLATGEVPAATCLPSSVVCLEGPVGRLTGNDRLYYGQYDKSNSEMMALLRELTKGKFRDGAIARILAREFWTKGEAPTLEQFAAAWTRATAEHTRPNPEWAFLSDLADKNASPDWKKLRAQRAKQTIGMLDELLANWRKSIRP